MHPEAHAGFGRMLAAAALDPTKQWRVLDIGGQDVNGTVHDYFTHPKTKITTLDLENADITADATTWRPSTARQMFDVVIATEVFEHVADWPAVLDTMRAALDPKGAGCVIATCASDGRPPHGATGAPLPADGEHYANVPQSDLFEALRSRFSRGSVEYLYPPGDAYLWARAFENGLEHPITVVIPTIAPRGNRQPMLERALASVEAQEYAPVQVIVEHAEEGEGPAVVRNRALAKVETPWVAFLDDDDYLRPNHLKRLALVQADSGADVVWPWFDVEGGSDPFPMFQGRQWDPEDPHQIPITVLARTEAIQAVGGFEVVGDGPVDQHGHRAGEDWRLWLSLSAAGYRFWHTEEKTWVWVHHGANTSGLPSRV